MLSLASVGPRLVLVQLALVLVSVGPRHVVVVSAVRNSVLGVSIDAMAGKAGDGGGDGAAKDKTSIEIPAMFNAEVKSSVGPE